MFTINNEISVLQLVMRRLALLCQEFDVPYISDENSQDFYFDNKQKYFGMSGQAFIKSIYEQRFEDKLPF